MLVNGFVFHVNVFAQDICLKENITKKYYYCLSLQKWEMWKIKIRQNFGNLKIIEEILMVEIMP